MGDRILKSDGQGNYSIQPITSGDSDSIDAFGRLRVSNPTTLFDAQNQYGKSPLFWIEKITNTSGNAASTHLPNESAVQLTVEASDTIIRQSRAYHRYQPGKSQLIFMTFGGLTLDADGTYRIGYFDADNGAFLEVAGTSIGVVQRSKTSGAVVNTRVEQADWNIDTLDGSSDSGITLDISKAQILVIDMEWLGVGRVRIGFVVDGIVHYVHEFLNANNLTTTYATTANLPLRYEITATGDLSGSLSLKAICAQVSSEGGFQDERGVPFSAGNGATLISVTTRRPIFSIRPRATFNSIVNRSQIIPEIIEAYAQDQDTLIEVVYGGTLTGASFSNVDATYSGIEQDVAATDISGGIVVLQTTVPAGGVGSGSRVAQILSKLPLALDIDGNHPTSPLTDVLSIVATAGSASDTAGFISGREIR